MTTETATTIATSPSSEAETRPNAEIVPFPISRTETGRHVAAEYARRPVKGRYGKAAYADGVIQVTKQRFERLGIAPERIAAEVSSLESMFAALSEPHAPKQASA